MTPQHYLALELQIAFETILAAVRTIALFFALGLLLVFFTLLLAMLAVRFSGEMGREPRARGEFGRAGATAGASPTFTRPRVQPPRVVVHEPDRRARARMGSRRRRSTGRLLDGWTRPALRRHIH